MRAGARAGTIVSRTRATDAASVGDCLPRVAYRLLPALGPRRRRPRPDANANA
ncbi:hypothetical protein HMPREF0004_5627 [Achromobacter piechaudii ATCC 43553]|uniref:Uncharacterized protein n=1 Tax=Achromobacter piechaudii ATCC 43553 TaxID=742159 RepID=D4XJI0_9BURK|nr:hypothetical protein HMPREF0004_5627 [Achromobacter piechaudii ATCC 43553]